MLGTVWWHLEPGEIPEQALRRELIEEISWQPPVLELVMVYDIQRRTAYVFRGALSVPLEQLQLLEGSIWSARLGCHRPLADGLPEVMQQVLLSGKVP